MSQPRPNPCRVYRCRAQGCHRLGLAPLCSRHRPAELTSVMRARCAGVKPWPLVPAVFKPTSSGAGRLEVANPAGVRKEHETE